MVTGGAGFIGCRLAQLAAAAGQRVTAVTAVNSQVEQSRYEMLTAGGVPVVIASLDEPAKLEQALHGQDVVIHLAAAQHEAQAPESHFRRVNVDGTRALLELAVKAGVQRFVYGSTTGVYGSGNDGILDETSPLAPDTPYGRTKAEAERVVREFADRLPVVIARIAETYGPGDRRLLKLFRAVRRGSYLTIGHGTNYHHLIYVDDLVRGLHAAAMAQGAVGATFILSGTESITTDEMVGAIAAAVGKALVARHVPLWPFSAAAFVMERTMSPLGLTPPLHQRRLDFFRKSFRFCTAQAERRLGFRAEVPFGEGARRTALWYREQGLLD